MPRFSLVVATLGRTEELQKLIDSVVNQGRTDIEIILVDQNDDDRVIPLASAIPAGIPVAHLRTTEKNVSRARNLGLDAARGEIVAFPDDDCWYPAGLLKHVDTWFNVHKQYAVFSVGAVDDEGLSSGNRWIQDACDITPLNCLRTTFCSSLFVAAVERSRAVRFDEKLNRGEETDFILRLLATGLKGRFEREFYVHHPRRDMLSGTVTAERAESYGAGMGRLVRRHSLVTLWIGLLAYDLVRASVVVLRGKFNDARFCFAHAQGLFRGFLVPQSQEKI